MAVSLGWDHVRCLLGFGRQEKQNNSSRWEQGIGD